MEERVSEIVKKLRDSREKSDISRCQRIQKAKERELDIRERELNLKDSSLSEDEFIRQKEVSFYSHTVSAFLSTRMELDKSLLTLSVAGLGFLLSFIKIDSNNIYPYFIVFLIAAFAFFCCILVVIEIFGENSKHLIELSNNDVKKTQKKLKYLDKMAKITFLIGVFLSISLAVASQYRSVNDIYKEDYNKKIGLSLVDIEIKIKEQK